MSDIAFKVLIGNGYDDILFKTIMLKGEKGDQGEAGGAEIDDSTTSSTKTWSSSKINSEISAKPSAFSQLNDVAISSISDGQMPVYDFTTGKWKNQNVDASTLKYNSVKTIKDELDAKASSLTDLDDVNITNPQNAEGMIYDATTGKWKNGNPAVSGNLDDLDDVQIDFSTLADGQAVKWDAQNNKWVNGAVSTTSALVDLTDVALDSSIPDFSSLVYIATLGKWANKKLTIACTEAQYETWKNASPSQLIPCTYYILTDAQNLNPTADDIEYSSGVSVADELNDLESNKTQVKFAKATLTTNSNGFCVINLTGKTVVILSAWSSSGDVLIVPFSASSAGIKGTGQWWFRVHNDSMQIRANFSFDLYYSYIET